MARSKSLNELLATPKPRFSYVINPQILPYAGVQIAYGKAGTLKSWIGIDAAFAVASGSPWLGRDAFSTTAMNSMLVQAEVPEHSFRERVEKFSASLNGAGPDEESLFFINDMELRLDSFEWQQRLMREIKERKVKFVVLDCLYQMVSGTVSAEEGMKKFMDAVDAIRGATGCAFFILHHPRKAQEDRSNTFEEMLGSSVLSNWADTIIRIEGIPASTPQPTYIQLTFEKVKNAEIVIPKIRLNFDRDTAQFS